VKFATALSEAPCHICNITLSVFRSRLKTHLFRRCFPRLYSPKLQLCLRSETVIVGHTRCSCYLIICRVKCFCGGRQLLPDGLQIDYQFISCLKLPVEYTLRTFPSRRPERDSPAGSNLEGLGPRIVLSESETLRLQPFCMTLERRERNAGCLS